MRFYFTRLLACGKKIGDLFAPVADIQVLSSWKAKV